MSKAANGAFPVTASIDHLKRLIAFPTVSRDSNLALIEHIAAFLTPLGFTCRVIESEDARKANLYASIGPADKAGIVLSGHTDVVPVTGQDWSCDPFQLTKKDGRLYGRGSADMKGFIACCLALAERLEASLLPVPVHFAFSYDEEVGCLGVRRMIDVMADMAVKPRFCIIGEPTSMQVVTAHKGKQAYRVTTSGLEAHSSLAPNGVNAIHLAVDTICELRQIQKEITETGTRDGDYDIAYTTVHVGTISGGEALNIVPNHCSFDFEIRHLPGDDPAAIMARVTEAPKRRVARARARFAGADIRFHERINYPALETPPDSDVVTFVKSLTGANATAKISFGTEGGLFQSRLGLPTVVCGPGSISVAHKPDEFIEESQMAACDRFLDKLVARISG